MKCGQCGCEFPRRGPNQLYCSDKCKSKAYYVAKVAAMDRICTWCKVPLKEHHNGQRYCSPECRRQSKAERLRLNKITVNRILNCHACGGPFEALTSNVRYCSAECRRVKEREWKQAWAQRNPTKPMTKRPKPAPATPERIVRGPCIIPLGELGTVTGRIVGRPMDYLGELCVPVVLTHQLDREPDWWPVGCVEVVEDEWA